MYVLQHIFRDSTGHRTPSTYWPRSSRPHTPTSSPTHRPEDPAPVDAPTFSTASPLLLSNYLTIFAPRTHEATHPRGPDAWQLDGRHTNGADNPGTGDEWRRHPPRARADITTTNRHYYGIFETSARASTDLQHNPGRRFICYACSRRRVEARGIRDNLQTSQHATRRPGQVCNPVNEGVARSRPHDRRTNQRRRHCRPDKERTTEKEKRRESGPVSRKIRNSRRTRRRAAKPSRQRPSRRAYENGRSSTDEEGRKRRGGRASYLLSPFAVQIV